MNLKFNPCLHSGFIFRALRQEVNGPSPQRVGLRDISRRAGLNYSAILLNQRPGLLLFPVQMFSSTRLIVKLPASGTKFLFEKGKFERLFNYCSTVRTSDLLS